MKIKAPAVYRERIGWTEPKPIYRYRPIAVTLFQHDFRAAERAPALGRIGFVSSVAVFGTFWLVGTSLLQTAIQAAEDLGDFISYNWEEFTTGLSTIYRAAGDVIGEQFRKVVG